MRKAAALLVGVALGALAARALLAHYPMRRR